MVVNSLTDELRLETYGSMDTENNRPLPQDKINQALLSLLKIHDPAFMLTDISMISGLECGVELATGNCFWAHRTEIEARDPVIQFYHDRITASSVVIEDPAKPSVPQISTQDDDSTSSTDSPVDPAAPPRILVITSDTNQRSQFDPARAEARLCILGVKNLRRVRLTGTQSPFCEWKVLDPSGQEITAGQTIKHTQGGTSPGWSAYPFLIPLPKNRVTLKDCTLQFVVKTPGAIIGTYVCVSIISVSDYPTTTTTLKLTASFWLFR